MRRSRASALVVAIVVVAIVIATLGFGNEGSTEHRPMPAPRALEVDYGFSGASGSLPNIPEFLYAKGDVLHILRVAVDMNTPIDDVAVPPILESAVRVLP